MQRCISSLSFSDPLAEKIRAAAEAGFAGIEIFREDIVGFDGTPEDIAALARVSGIAITSLQSLRDWEASPPESRDWCDTQAARFLDLAQRLGAPLLVVCANTRADALPDPAQAAADLARLADMAAARGLRVGYEALAATSTHVKTYARAWDIVQRAARPNLGLVINAIHTFAAEAGLGALATLDMGRIELVHLADAPTTRIDPRLMTESFRLLPGQGNLPVAELYAGLVTRGYAGPMSMEIFNDQLRALEPALIARDAMRSFDLLDDRLAADGAVPSAVTRVGFIELACRTQDAAALAQLLTGLGFVKTHAGRGLSAWAQGEITLLQNEAEAGLAHSVYLMQGLTVASLGLQVSDLAPFAKIAEPGAKAGGHDLPLVRGPGGAAFYLLDRPLAETPLFRALVAVKGAAPGKGLTRIDHFAQALVPNLFLSALLFYRAIFDFRSESQRDVLDPHGTVHSRVVANDAGTVRLSLNSSLSAGTSTTRFLEKAGYAAWHHFAFACPDIFAVAAGLAPEQVLRMPPNYYDDLYLRFDLPEPLVERMRAANVLYDRDAQGVYFQLYTRAINGLFFEVVQREGYAGLGAPNAGVRMLAQAREYEAQHALDMF